MSERWMGESQVKNFDIETYQTRAVINAWDRIGDLHDYAEDLDVDFYSNQPAMYEFMLHRGLALSANELLADSAEEVSAASIHRIGGGFMLEQVEDHIVFPFPLLRPDVNRYADLLRPYQRGDKWEFTELARELSGEEDFPRPADPKMRNMKEISPNLYDAMRVVVGRVGGHRLYFAQGVADVWTMLDPYIY